MIRITKKAGGTSYANPFIGPVQHPANVLIDVSTLSANEVDAKGYLKPGVPVNKTGDLVTAGFVFGVTIEATKIAEDNTDLANTPDTFVAVETSGLVNRDIVEDILGRALTAAEIAGFDAAGSKLALTTT
jgi:hypothetical protein